MSEELMLKCLIAFVLGWIVSRHMGNGFSVGGTWYSELPGLVDLPPVAPPALPE